MLVQQDEKAALKPIDKLYGNMLYFGLIKILVLALLIPILWERLLWMMRRREKRAHA